MRNQVLELPHTLLQRLVACLHAGAQQVCQGFTCNCSLADRASCRETQHQRPVEHDLPTESWSILYFIAMYHVHNTLGRSLQRTAFWTSMIIHCTLFVMTMNIHRLTKCIQSTLYGSVHSASLHICSSLFLQHGLTSCGIKRN